MEEDILNYSPTAMFRGTPCSFFFINLTILPSCIGCWIGNEFTERSYLFINSKPSSEIPLLDIHLSGTQSVSTPWYSPFRHSIRPYSLIFTFPALNPSLLLDIHLSGTQSVPTPWYLSSYSLVYDQTHWNTSLLLGVHP